MKRIIYIFTVVAILAVLLGGVTMDLKNKLDNL